MPTVPGYVSDGDFKIARQNGAASFTQPFASSRNDFSTFIARRTMRVEDGYYANPVPMSQFNFGQRGIGYLVDVESPSAIDGSNLLEYAEVYASLPPTHRDYGTATASIQIPYKLVSPDDPEVFGWQMLNLNDSFDAVFVYEYSLNAPLPALLRTRLVQIKGSITQFDAAFMQAGFTWKKPPVDGLYLAQNSTSFRWMGGIFCRESIYVTAPPVTKYNGLPPSE